MGNAFSPHFRFIIGARTPASAFRIVALELGRAPVRLSAEELAHPPPSAILPPGAEPQALAESLRSRLCNFIVVAHAVGAKQSPRN